MASSIDLAVREKPARAEKQNGVKRASKPNRKQLLFEFDMQREAQERGHDSRQYFIGDPYPPSTKAVCDLSPIHFSDLQLETHHHGHVLFVRNIEDEARAAACHTIVEDETGDVERFALYNVISATKTDVLLSKGALFAVKEPYYEVSASGVPSLRVDHPSDLVPLSEVDSLLPTALRSAENDETALSWKTKGNDAYKAGDYVRAAKAYTQSLKLCCDDDMMKYDLLRNRAIVNTYLKRFEPAFADGKAAVITQDSDIDEKTASLNAKAYHRAGRAAYELGHLADAEDCFSKEKELVSTDEDGAREIKRCQTRLAEQSSGGYDFTKISTSVSKKHNRLDHASFLTKTTIREAGAHGRGLFATEKIETGELVLCEKSFCVSFDSDADAMKNISILNSRSQRNSSGTEATLLFHIVQKLLYNPGQTYDFFKLLAGGDSEDLKEPLQTIDGLVPVDVFRVLGVINHNALGCPTVRSSSENAQKQLAGGSGYPSTGIWLTVAYVNHACNGNAMRSFIGDMMILRATRDIAEGEEILMPYRLPNADNSVTQSAIEKIWGFKCDCDLCDAEAKTQFRQRKERIRLVNEVETLLSAHPVSAQKKPSSKITTQVQKLYSRLESTYDEKVFERRPRVGLVAPGLWLCQAYHLSESWSKLADSAIRVLRDLGYIVTVAEDSVLIERQHCHLVPSAVETAMYAAHAFHKQGKAEVGRRMEELATGLYETMYGETRGFDKKYDSIRGGPQGVS